MLEQAEQSGAAARRLQARRAGRQAIAPVAAVSLVLADGVSDEDTARLTMLGTAVRATQTDGADAMS